MEKVGLVGAGVMGRSAAAKLIQAGHPVVVCDVSTAAVKKVEGMGAEALPMPAQVARDARCVLMFLPGPDEVVSAVIGQDGLLSGAGSGSVIIDMSTVDPTTSLRMEEKARAQKVGYLDAPVLGRPDAVGNWALPVGGSSVDLENVRGILEVLASRLFSVGPIGSGNRVKLLNQLMFGAINAMTAEMMAVADKMGISLAMVWETITSSQAGTVSGLFKELGRRVAEDDYENATFTVDLLIKDVRLAVQMASDNSASPFLGRVIESINEAAKAQGLGGKDTAVMWKAYRKMWEGNH